MSNNYIQKEKRIMENQNANQQLTAQLVKSNASEFLVWEVSITNSRKKKHYCKNARKALNLLFILKKETGLAIEYDTMRHLKAILAKQSRNAATIAAIGAQQ